MDFFTSHFKKKEYKYSIYNTNSIIHFLFEKKKCKFLFHNDVSFIPLLPEKMNVNFYSW